MKLLLPVLAAAATLATTAQAAQCSSATLRAFKATPEFLAFLDMDCSAPVPVSTPCGQIKCLAALEAVVAVAPDCENMGANLRAEYEADSAKHRQNCKADGSTVPPHRDLPTTPATRSPSTTAPGGEVKDCTTSELIIISNDVYADAWKEACMSPRGTDKDVATKKTCAKACFDAWRKQLDDRPHCLLSGRKYFEEEEESFTSVKKLCAEAVGNTTETSSSSSSPATSAPALSTSEAASTTSAPTSTSTAPSTPAPTSASCSVAVSLGVLATAVVSVATTFV